MQHISDRENEPSGCINSFKALFKTTKSLKILKEDKETIERLWIERSVREASHLKDISVMSRKIFGQQSRFVKLKTQNFELELANGRLRQQALAMPESLSSLVSEDSNFTMSPERAENGSIGGLVKTIHRCIDLLIGQTLSPDNDEDRDYQCDLVMEKLVEYKSRVHDV
jgi:hypothetical protein